jgi:hypothetical protein
MGRYRKKHRERDSVLLDAKLRQFRSCNCDLMAIFEVKAVYRSLDVRS